MRKNTTMIAFGFAVLAAALFIHVASAQGTGGCSGQSCGSAANTCSLFGGTTYAGGWLSINLFVILIAFLIGAAVYAMSRVFMERSGSQMRNAVRSEITQLVLSLVIIVILLGFSQGFCSVSSSLSKSLLLTTNPSHSGLDPFQYADYYLAQLSVGTGLNLLTNVYSTSIAYSFDAAILTQAGGMLQEYTGLVNSISSGFGPVQVQLETDLDLGVAFSILSTVYLTLYASIITVTIGTLFMQVLLIPVAQDLAFTVLLPVAIVMRSISFSGTGLRNAANAVLAIAIAVYLIYPMMIVFDSYITTWAFCQTPSGAVANPNTNYIQGFGYCSPDAAYLSKVDATYSLSNLPPPNQFLSSNAIPTSSLTSIDPNSAIGFAFSGFQSLPGGFWSSILPNEIINQSEKLVTDIAEFFFLAVVLFAINIAVTLGFAVGLSKALNSGVEGAGSFWSNI